MGYSYSSSFIPPKIIIILPSTLLIRFLSFTTPAPLPYLLRVYVAFSDGDITLTRNTKFLSLNRAGRKVFLRLMDNIAKNSEYTIDDMAAHDFLWKKALEKLHIGDYSSMFPNAYKVATMLRNDDYKTYNSSIVLAYKKRDVQKFYILFSKCY